MVLLDTTDIKSIRAYAQRAAEATSVAEFLLGECARMRERRMVGGRKLYNHVKDGGFRLWMPYAFVKIEHPERELWLPINRDYSLLGQRVWTHYNEHAALAIEFKGDPRWIGGVWWKAPFDENIIKCWLYSDDPKSWIGYGERLKTLLDQRVRTREVPRPRPTQTIAAPEKQADPEIMPLPPRSVRGGPFQPMSRRDLRRWIEGYNAWVDLWNEHETNHDLPLGPEWQEAEIVGNTRHPSFLIFAPRHQQDWEAWVRVAGWEAFDHGPLRAPWLRQKADLKNVVWAGWRGSTQQANEPVPVFPAAGSDVVKQSAPR